MQVIKRKIDQNHSQDRSDCSDTCQSLPQQPPPKIIQERVRHTFQKLTSLPKVVGAVNIKHLYLSHNCLTSLKGIEQYSNITSLNISYNCLKNISELRLIDHPHLMKRISLRQNQFQYGYEDYTVGIFPNLQKLDDTAIEKAEVKIKMVKMRNFLAGALIKFAIRCQLIIEYFEKQENKQNIFNSINIQGEKTVKKDPKILSACQKPKLLELLKDYYIDPRQRSFSVKSTKYLLTLTSTIVDIVNSADIYVLSSSVSQQSYGQTTNNIFKNICDEILIKFRQKHDCSLANFIQKRINENTSYVTAFAQLGVIHQQDHNCQKEVQMTSGGITYLRIAQNHSKYMNKINKQALIDHPMNHLATWLQPQYNTLIEQQNTKWYNFYHQGKQQSTQERQDIIFERIPIFIYCKEYLQIITEIVLDRISMIINLEHQNCSQESIHPHSQHAHTSTKKEDQIQLNLSDSQIISFGNQEESNELLFKEDPISLTQDKQCSVHKESTKIDHQTFPTYQRNCKLSPLLDLNKYSLYDISLIFKVLRGLKKRVKKRKSKREGKGKFQV